MEPHRSRQGLLERPGLDRTLALLTWVGLTAGAIAAWLVGGA